MKHTLANQNVYASIDADSASYAVVGMHPKLGSGVLYWLETRYQADYNANVVRMTGGSADVKTKAEAMFQ